jgi:hypothetical protein
MDGTVQHNVVQQHPTAFPPSSVQQEDHHVDTDVIMDDETGHMKRSHDQAQLKQPPLSSSAPVPPSSSLAAAAAAPVPDESETTLPSLKKAMSSLSRVVRFEQEQQYAEGHLPLQDDERLSAGQKQDTEEEIIMEEKTMSDDDSL